MPGFRQQALHKPIGTGPDVRIVGQPDHTFGDRVERDRYHKESSENAGKGAESDPDGAPPVAVQPGASQHMGEHLAERDEEARHYAPAGNDDANDEKLARYEQHDPEQDEQTIDERGGGIEHEPHP